MVEQFQDKKISEFVEGNVVNQDEMTKNDPLEHAFAHGQNSDQVSDTNSQKSSEKQSFAATRLRQMTDKAKQLVTEARQALALDDEDDYLNTMTINEEVKVIEWAPAVFQAIRQMDGITPEMIVASLNTDSNAKQLFKAKESAGKSGSFMFSSFDKRFLIKTMNKSEQKVLMDALPLYLDHLKKHQDTLIAKIYGIYTVKMEDIREVHILLMDNLFLHVKEKHSEFDLKGSIINREVHMPFTMKDCLKDVNLQRISKQDKFLRFQRKDMRLICERILEDITFMANRNLMDYSLLLITEINPDYVDKEDDFTQAIQTRSNKSVKSQNSAQLAVPENTLLKRQVSGIPEV